MGAIIELFVVVIGFLTERSIFRKHKKKRKKRSDDSVKLHK